MKKLRSIVMTTLLFAGCSGMTADLQQASARSIGDPNPDDVKVANVERTARSATWDIATSQGSYKCKGSDLLKVVECVKQ
jgi:PBP1b-binding outer membrane lipoprotein LpoB